MKIETVYADKVFAFLLELEVAAKSSGDSSLLSRILTAKAFYTMPVTSEFLGESMQTMKEALEVNRETLSPDQRELAGAYITAIKKQWFS